jgi:hypothetical protein
MKLTAKDRKTLRDEKARAVEAGKQIFLERMKEKVPEGFEDVETFTFLTDFFCDAFWDGYLFAIAEQAIERVKNEVM